MTPSQRKSVTALEDKVRCGKVLPLPNLINRNERLLKSETLSRGGCRPQLVQPFAKVEQPRSDVTLLQAGRGRDVDILYMLVYKT